MQRRLEERKKLDRVQSHGEKAPAPFRLGPFIRTEAQ